MPGETTLKGTPRVHHYSFARICGRISCRTDLDTDTATARQVRRVWTRVVAPDGNAIPNRWQ